MEGDYSYTINLSRIPLQCVRTIEPERGWGGHFRTFLVFLPTLTSIRRHYSLECGKCLFRQYDKRTFAEHLKKKFPFSPLEILAEPR